MPNLFRLKEIHGGIFTLEGIPGTSEITLQNTGEHWRISYTEALASFPVTQFGELQALLAKIGARNNCLFSRPEHKALEEEVNARILIRWFIDNMTSEGVVPERPVVIRYGTGEFRLELGAWRMTEMSDVEKIRLELPRLRAQFDAIKNDYTGIGYAISKKEDEIRHGQTYQAARLTLMKKCHEKLAMAPSDLAQFCMDSFIVDSLTRIDKSIYYAVTKVANQILTPAERWAVNVFPSFKKRISELEAKSRQGFFFSALTAEEKKELDTTRAYQERAAAIVCSMDMCLFKMDRFLIPAVEAAIGDLKVERGDVLVELLGLEGSVKDSLLYALIAEIARLWVESGFEYPKAPERYLMHYYQGLKTRQSHDLALFQSHFLDNGVELPVGEMMCFFAKKRINFELPYHCVPTVNFFEVATVLILKAYRANYIESLPDSLREHIEHAYSEDKTFLSHILSVFRDFESKKIHFDEHGLQSALELLARNLSSVKLVADPSQPQSEETSGPVSPEVDDGGHEFEAYEQGASTVGHRMP